MDDEREQVEAARAGERTAFTRLYDRYGRTVFLWIAGRLPHREDAEDVLQSVFLDAWRNLPRLRRADRFGPWLFRIAHSRVADHMRGRLPRAVALGPGEDLIGPSLEPGDDGEELRRSLGGLRPESRSLVLLKAVEGRSTEEIARLLSVSPSTVRRRYARALSQLRRSLTEDARHADRT